MAERALATAFVNIVPGTKALEQYLKGDLAGAAKTAGAESGDNIAKGINKKLKNVGVDELSKSGKKAGDGFGKSFGASVKKLIGPAIAAAGVAAVGNFVGSTVNAAKALNVEWVGVEQVFGDSAKAVQEFGENAAKTAGLSTSAALQAAKGFGVIATEAGLATSSAATFSTSLVQTAGDLASFYGTSSQDALAAVTSALQGQAEPLRRYGIFLDEAKLKQAAFDAGIISSIDQALTPQQKALATQAYLTENLGVATGDFATYGDSFDNALQTATASLENMQASIGMALLPSLGILVTSLQPVIDQLGPILGEVIQGVIPLFEFLATAMNDLIPIIEPLIGVFGTLIETAIVILEAVWPPLVAIMGALLPVIDDLAILFAHLVEKVLPPVIKIINDILVPILVWLADLIVTYLIPYWTLLADLLGNILTPVVDGLAGAFQWVAEKIAPLWEVIKPFIEGFMSLLGIKPVKLSVTTTFKSEDKRFNSLAGVAAIGAGAAGATGSGLGAIDFSTVTGASGVGAGGAKTKPTDNTKAIKSLIKTTKKAIKAARKEYNKAVKDANDEFVKVTAEALAKYDETVIQLTQKRNEQLAELELDHAKKVADITADFNGRLADIIRESKDRLRSAFKSVASIDVGATFAELGTRNVDALIRNLKEKLGAARKLVANAGALASAGFSQTFIEQIVSQGPQVGNAMAEAVLAGSPESQAELQSLFSESEKLANHGMDSLADSLYEKQGLATEALRTLYVDTQEELRIALAEQETLYNLAQENIMLEFDKGMLEAADVRDKALADAQTAFSEAITEATTKFNDEIKEIGDNFNAKVAEFRGKLGEYEDDIGNLKKTIANIKFPTIPTIPTVTVKTTNLTPMASGGFVTKPTPALVGEAGPEVITPLADFERMMNLDGRSGNTIIYNAAPNKSLDAEQDLFVAMQRARVLV